MLRAETVENFNMVDYFIHTYEDDMDRRYLPDTGDTGQEAITDESRRRPGRPANERMLYLPQHPKYTKKLRIMRCKGHNQLPNFIGRFFPRADDPETTRFYCACMLLLLKPWRNIDTDLKLQSQTWPQAFDAFLTGASKKAKDVLSGTHSFYEY
jgi:hypothetical protein